MSAISELQMSFELEKLLKSQELIKGIPNFDIIYKEVSCQQGVADFVGVTSKNGNSIYSLNMFDNIQPLDSGTLIFSILKFKAARSKSYLKETTGLSETTINKVLRDLIKKNLVCEIKKDLYVLSPDLKVPQIDIWAFELKLSNWKRALFQALQYKAFANYSFVVVPIEKEKLLVKNLNLFKELNVGILVFDYEKRTLKLLLKPKKERPSSKWHTLFAMGKLANELSLDINSIAIEGSNKYVDVFEK